MPQTLPVQLPPAKQFPHPCRASEQLIAPQAHSDIEKARTMRRRLGSGRGDIAYEVGTHLNAFGIEEGQMRAPRRGATASEMIEAGQKPALRRTS